MRPLVHEGQTWWLAKADEIRAPSGIPVRFAIEKIVQKFGFLAWPTTISNPSDGYIFKEGSYALNGRIVAVQSLTIYTDGIHVVASSTTEDSDKVLQAVLSTLAEMGMRQPTTSPLQYNVSTIVADFDNRLDHLVSKFEVLSSIISSRVQGEGVPELGSIAFWADPALAQGRIWKLNPTTFRLEKRAGSEFGVGNRYFSTANATTEKHLEILNQVEALLSE